MTITQHISIDLQQPGNAPMIYAVQGEEYTRVVEIDLYSGGVAWNPPSGCEVVIRYGKPDGKGGVYGNLPDGTTAWSIEGNTISVILAPQMLTVPGIVNAQAQLIVNAKEIISTFHFSVNVEEDSSKGAVKSENYVNWKTYYIPQTAGAIVGQYLQISKVDADGKVVGVRPVDDPAKGAKDYANAAYDKANEALSTAETTRQLADIAIGKSDQALTGLSYMSQNIQRIEDEQQSVKDSISGKLPTPATAQVGQTIVVKSIDENGAVTAVKAVDAPSGGGGGGSDEVFVMLEDGSVVSAEVEFDLSDENTPALVVVPDTAKVGQTIAVKAVDQNGKPTEWKAVDLPSGDATNSKEWKLLNEVTLEESEVTQVAFTEDKDGNPFSCEEIYLMVFGVASQASGWTLELGCTTNPGYSNVYHGFGLAGNCLSTDGFWSFASVEHISEVDWRVSLGKCAVGSASEGMVSHYDGVGRCYEGWQARPDGPIRMVKILPFAGTFSAGFKAVLYGR
jgi:hypothetical protein